MTDTAQTTARTLLQRARILPVVTVETVEQALAVAGALVEGGLHAIELTLRTPMALDALAEVKATFPALAVGAGTVLVPDQMDAVIARGADFIVTPGTSPGLLAALRRSSIPVIPGAGTPSEVMALAEHGFSAVKLFPATAVGGLGLVKALQGPLGHITLCPTGGIDATSAADYLAQPNVVCVGGSWMVKPAWISDGDYDAIRDASAETARRMIDPHGITI